MLLIVVYICTCTIPRSNATAISDISKQADMCRTAPETQSNDFQAHPPSPQNNSGTVKTPGRILSFVGLLLKDVPLSAYVFVPYFDFGNNSTLVGMMQKMNESLRNCLNMPDNFLFPFLDRCPALTHLELLVHREDFGSKYLINMKQLRELIGDKYPQLLRILVNCGL